MSDRPIDVLILGGGPAGSTAATSLAQAGRRVVLLEKEPFPRFHIGESLLPYNRRLFANLGVLEKLQEAGFVSKHGAQFHSGNGQHHIRFAFARGSFTRETEAFQVERSRFDKILLDHARSCGAEIREGWTAKSVQTSSQTAEITALDPKGTPTTLRATYVIDATGRGNLTGNQERLRKSHPRLKKLALFSHFEGARTDPREAGGDTVMIRSSEHWFWLIPVSTIRVSVGCVMDASRFSNLKKTPEEVFHQACQSSPAIRDRMAHARSVLPLHTTSDFSYLNRKLAGNRILRTGDAAGFLDPIFSSGVYLAMVSARMAANTLVAVLQKPTQERGEFQRYEKRLTALLMRYWRFVELFYEAPLMDFFFAPTERLKLASAINALLAGEIEPSWGLKARLLLFEGLVKLQQRWPVVPRRTLG